MGRRVGLEIEAIEREGVEVTFSPNMALYISISMPPIVLSLGLFVVDRIGQISHISSPKRKRFNINFFVAIRIRVLIENNVWYNLTGDTVQSAESLLEVQYLAKTHTLVSQLALNKKR
jgi:hypothetical protein